MSYEEYTWLKYYADLYHRQKKINNTLAMQIGETTAKNMDLEIALNRVINSKLWKSAAPARKIYSLIKGDKGHVNTAKPGRTVEAGETDTNTDNQGLDDSLYQKRLEFYEDFYGQWIRKNEIENHYMNYHSDSGRSRVRESLYIIKYIEECAGINSPLLEVSENQWLLFVSKKGKLANGYAERLSLALEEKENVVIAYSDEDYFYSFDGDDDNSTCNGIRRIEPNFKPEWSPDTLDSFFYFGHIALIKGSLAKKLTWLGNVNPWENIYDLFLQAAEFVGKHYDTPEVMHIPQVLFHNDANEYAVTTGNAKCGRRRDTYSLWKGTIDRLKEDLYAGKLCIGASSVYDSIKFKAFERRGLKAKLISGQDPDVQNIQYLVPEETKISVLIPTKDHPEVLKTCLASFIERTEYKNLEFIIVDNGSTEANKSTYMDVIESVCGGNEDGSERKYDHKYIYEPMEFNFSTMCNLAARNASGDLLLFLNDDVEIVQKDWLGLMAGYAALDHVGAVGAKLLYANSDLIQHIGVTSLSIGPSHKLVIYPDDKHYYYGRNMFAYDMLGVTGACLLVDKNKFNLVGGFDENFAVAYNDVDLCMKLSKSGFVNLQCNGALLYHYESLTRGLDEVNAEKWDRLLHEKDRLYSRHREYYQYDPYYNPNLIGNHSNYLSFCDYGYNIHVKYESVRKLDASKLAEKQADEYRISIDFAGIQMKENLEEPVITEVKGWCFKEESDNSLTKVMVILKNEATGDCFEVETDVMPRDDLEKAFPNAINNRLCGFTAKMLREDLPKGVYHIGIAPYRLNDDLTDGKSPEFVIYTGTRITI